MDIKMRVKIHNRFDIEVKDVISGKIIQKAFAENIVLDSMFSYLCSSGGSRTIQNFLHFGSGTGQLSVARTTLFTPLGNKQTVAVEKSYNIPPSSSFGKRKIVLLPEEYVGAVISEVGISHNTTNILTHAFLKDVAGNQISIGPKTELQEITIYSTVFAEVILPEGVELLLHYWSNTNQYYNILLDALTGYETSSISATSGNERVQLYISSNKNPTNPFTQYVNGVGQIGYFENAFFQNGDISNKNVKTNRIRYNSGAGNGRIWSMVLSTGSLGTSSTYYKPLVRILFPNSFWSGYHFEGKNIGTADGSKTKFVLPWSDINTSKQYDFYVDGTKKTAGIDYTLANAENETSITFATPPVSGAVTGDWWVDYIPKDTDHVLDVTFTITYGEGA